MKINILDYIPRLIASWLSVFIFLNLTINKNYEITNTQVILGLIISLISFIIYSFLNKKLKKINIDSLMLLVNYIICVFKWINKVSDILFIISLIIFFVIIIVYFVNKNYKIINKINMNKKIFLILSSIIILIPLIILLVIGILRYYNFNAPNFDFGIFSHNFYYLKETLIPYSTCERDMLLSHFAVHFSPIFYLILPIYFIFSSPVTLQISQVIILYFGLIPLLKICNIYKFDNKKKLFILILYCFYPVLSTGTFYDFHENCFLVPLLLFVFYSFEKNNKLLLYISILLTLMVKEDAAIYLIIFSIYIILSRKEYKRGIIIFLISLIYFITVTYLMNKFGLGIMSNRYENLIVGDSGLIGALKTIIFNPGYTLTQLLTTTRDNYDKLIYLIKIFLPILFIPVITKKFSRYILLVPLLINLLTNYTFMYDINFQYSFGILAFLFYLIILNLNDIKDSKIIYIMFISTIICLIFYYSLVIPTFKNKVKTYVDNKEEYKLVRKNLNKIPTDASVSSSTFYLPHLTNRKEVYEVFYHEYKTDIDYVVLDMRYDEQEYLEYYLDNGYEVYIDEESITILKKSEDNDKKNNRR